MSTARPAARLEDVAKLAGVSAKTVSNVVNDYVHVRPATRTKVQEAIDLLGYRPNVVARNLKNGRSGVIALALPELDAPYFAELAHHVVQEAMHRGWTVLVDETGQIRDPEVRARERSAVAGIREHLIDGVILNPLALDDADVERYGSVPLVLLGERLGSHLADHVAIDNQAAAAEATRHLIATGRRRIAVVGAQPRPFGHSARLRLRGYRDALAEAGLRYDPSLVVEALDWRRQPGADGGPPAAGPARARRTRSSASTTCSPWARSAGCATPGCSVPQRRGRRGLRRHRGEPLRHALADHAWPPTSRRSPGCAVEHLARRLEPGLWTPEEVTVG